MVRVQPPLLQPESRKIFRFFLALGYLISACLGDEKENVFIWEYFVDIPAVIDYLKDNGVIEKDIQPTKGAIVAVLSEIEEGRPDDISFILEEFVVVDD